LECEGVEFDTGAGEEEHDDLRRFGRGCLCLSSFASRGPLDPVQFLRAQHILEPSGSGHNQIALLVRHKNILSWPLYVSAWPARGLETAPNLQSRSALMVSFAPRSAAK